MLVLAKWLGPGELSTTADILSSTFHSFTSSSEVYIYKHIMAIVAATPFQKFKLAQQRHRSSSKAHNSKRVTKV